MLVYVSRTARRLVDCEPPPLPSDSVPSAMEAPMYSDLRMTLTLLEHRFAAHQQSRASFLDFEKAYMLLCTYTTRCGELLEQMSRREAKGVSRQLLELGAELGLSSSTSTDSQFKEAAALARRLVGATETVCNTSPFAFGANTAGAAPSTANTPTVVEVLTSFTALNPEQLSVTNGDTVVVKQADSAMVLVQLLREGDKVGQPGWVPQRCVQISPAQLAKLECDVVINENSKHETDALAMRAKLAQMERTLREIEGKHSEQLASVRAQGNRTAEDRIEQERVKCAAQIHEYAQKLEEAHAEALTAKADATEKLEDAEAVYKSDMTAAKFKWEQQEQELKASFQKATESYGEEKDKEWEAKLEQVEEEWETKMRIAEEEFREGLAMMN